MVNKELLQLRVDKSFIDAVDEQAIRKKTNRSQRVRDLLITSMTDEMHNDKEHPVLLQWSAYKAGLSSEEATAMLYCTWARAKRGEADYRFEELKFKEQDGTERKFWIAIGPSDTEKSIEDIKHKMKAYMKIIFRESRNE